MLDAAFLAGRQIRIKQKLITNYLGSLAADNWTNATLLQIYTVLGNAAEYNSYVGRVYTSAPTVSITGDGTGATATATITNGRVSAVTITAGGTGYTTATITFSGGGGLGAKAIAVLSGTSVSSATVIDESLVARLISKNISLDVDFAAL